MTVKEAWEEDIERYLTNNLWINKGIADVLITYIKTKYSVQPLGLVPQIQNQGLDVDYNPEDKFIINPKSTPENTTDNNEILN